MLGHNLKCVSPITSRGFCKQNTHEPRPLNWVQQHTIYLSVCYLFLPPEKRHIFLIGPLNFSLGCSFLLHLIWRACRHTQSTGVLPSSVLPAAPALTSPTLAHLFWQTIQTQLEVLMQCKYLPAKKVISFQPDQLSQLFITEAITKA